MGTRTVGPEGWRLRRVEAPKGGGPQVGPEGWEAQNIGLFFPRPPKCSFFLLLLGVLSLNFGGAPEGRDPQMCTFGVIGLSCEAPAAPRVPAFKNTKIQREDTQRDRKKTKWGRERKKKAKCWAVRRRGVRRRVVQGVQTNNNHNNHNHNNTNTARNGGWRPNPE